MGSNIKDIKKDINKLASKVVKSDCRAKNKAVAKIKTESRRIIQSKYNLKAKDVSKTIKIKRASYSNPESSMTFKSHATPIIAPMLKTIKIMSGSRKKRGAYRGQKIKVHIKKGSHKNLSGGRYKPFLMRVGGSKLIVARRVSEKRYSTSQVRTVPVAKMADNKDVSKHILKIGSETYDKEFKRLMELSNV
ncbi:Phage protein [Candidatus Arthromitus sp. SFB-mouse-NL]|uniref:phage tail protein n=1 Tax=Candidatus Arthromitus sp. SFB-mouse-NL TaxID=1508644 RepID=UPI00049A88CD|nr:phage tail protein [Candidatus Arthromitus sp. SFB-mouse-NL]AID45439.1 Phage protein [Candidatus Arthromitus sp. SFB-mouse-NL]